MQRIILCKKETLTCSTFSYQRKTLNFSQRRTRRKFNRCRFLSIILLEFSIHALKVSENNLRFYKKLMSKIRARIASLYCSCFGCQMEMFFIKRLVSDFRVKSRKATHLVSQRTAAWTLIKYEFFN